MLIRLREFFTNGVLTNNQLKIIALAAMTCDHIGKQLLPQFDFLQVLGRLALPIFAYMIAEGAFYTKKRLKYFLNLSLLALACQLVYFLVMGSLYQCILVTFSLSLCLIFAFDYCRKKQNLQGVLVAGAALTAVLFICTELPVLLSHTDFWIDYGIWGVLLPLFVSLGKKKSSKLLLAALGMLLLTIDLGGIQWYSFAALPLLALYNGKRGKLKMKNLFYIYYPAHLVVIYLISLL